MNKKISPALNSVYVRESKGVASILIILFLAIVGVVGYAALKSTKSTMPILALPTVIPTTTLLVTCGPCPLYSPPDCEGGRLIPGGVDECGCQLAPGCERSPNNGGGCVIGGCNNELCQDEDEEPLASICLYKPEYECYKSATCERQIDGECAWTQAEELKACLAQY